MTRNQINPSANKGEMDSYYESEFDVKAPTEDNKNEQISENSDASIITDR